jgi:hypothetical protein
MLNHICWHANSYQQFGFTNAFRLIGSCISAAYSFQFLSSTAAGRQMNVPKYHAGDLLTSAFEQ